MDINKTFALSFAMIGQARDHERYFIMTPFTLEVLLDKQVYGSPDTVNVLITFKNDKQPKLESLVCQLTGTEEVSFLTPNNRVQHRDTNVFLSQTCNLLDSYCEEAGGAFGGVYFKPGSHIFTVDFEIPKGQPSSLQLSLFKQVYPAYHLKRRFEAAAEPHPYGLLGMMISAPFDIQYKFLQNLSSGWLAELEKEFALRNNVKDDDYAHLSKRKQRRVKRRNKPRPPPITQQTFRLNWMWCIPRETLSATVRLEQDRIGSGETGQCRIFLDTQRSLMRIEGIRLSIVSKVRLSSSRQEDLYANFQTICNETDIHGPPIGAGLKEVERCLEFTIPPDFPPTFASKMITVEHFVNTEFCLSFSKTRAVISLPIKIDDPTGDSFYYYQHADPPPAYF